MITAHTDGAASGNPGPGGWAVLINGELISGREDGPTTNNAMELLAAYQAVLHCPASAHLKIITDSKLVIGWLSKGWRMNHQHIRGISDAYCAVRDAKQIRVTFAHVRGHKGHPDNDRVDKAARAQARIGRNLALARAG